MRVQMSWLTPRGPDERFDLGAPFLFHLIDIDIRELFDQRYIFEEVPIFVRDGRNRFRR